MTERVWMDRETGEVISTDEMGRRAREPQTLWDRYFDVALQSFLRAVESAESGVITPEELAETAAKVADAALAAREKRERFAGEGEGDEREAD